MTTYYADILQFADTLDTLVRALEKRPDRAAEVPVVKKIAAMIRESNLALQAEAARAGLEAAARGAPLDRWERLEQQLMKLQRDKDKDGRGFSLDDL